MISSELCSSQCLQTNVPTLKRKKYFCVLALICLNKASLAKADKACKLHVKYANHGPEISIYDNVCPLCPGYFTVAVTEINNYTVVYQSSFKVSSRTRDLGDGIPKKEHNPTVISSLLFAKLRHVACAAEELINLLKAHVSFMLLQWVGATDTW